MFKTGCRKEKQDPEFQSEKHQRSQMERLGGAERCSKCRKCVHLDGLSVVGKQTKTIEDVVYYVAEEVIFVEV
jgi:hypothetical protein